MLGADRPFVLLDDARERGAAPARLYCDPVDIVTADEPAQVPRLLRALRLARKAGLHAAGYLTYEAGAALEDRLRVNASTQTGPLAWFGLFRDHETLAPDAVAGWLPSPAGAWTGPARPSLSEEDYLARFAQVQALIRAGDIYQANLTFPAEVPVMGPPLAIYAALRARTRAGYGGVVWTGETWLLSLSPELFLALRDGRLTARPMKGTLPSEAAPTALLDDPKQRAENLMIVDLLRNDLSRIARPGSVAVPELFRVESYPTVHQMVSTVVADLADGCDAVDAIEATFPCGSITGAPKIRAMEVIREIEATPRGAYCGAIGRLDPDGDAAFNVAIRTLVLTPGAATARIGIGSGIVVDSRGADEWRECLDKARFVTGARRTPDLIETMRFDPVEGIPRLERHLARMKASAAAFGIAFDRHQARNELQAATFRLRTAVRIRLLTAASGRTAIEIGMLPPPEIEPLKVTLVPLPVDPADFRLRHKTTDRAFYDRARRETRSFEVVLARTDGLLTEGSFTNLFVERDGRLLTPPAALGLLPGILREELIDDGRAEEAELTVADLAGGFWLGNALRGLMRAELVAAVQHPGL